MQMIMILVRNWWAVALRGGLGIALGLVLLLFPLVSLRVLVLLIGAYVLADGLLALLSGVVAAREHSRWGTLLIEGILGVGAGVVAFLWPDLTLVMLIFLVAGWAVATGLIEIVAAVRLRKSIDGEWLLALCGGVSLALGLAMFLWPKAAAVALAWILGGYGVIFGGLLLALGLRLRRLGRGQPQA
jgi:uncharacterized membrane protein HdeD (DUF308 family)